jgi:hypothetical protein
MIRRARRVTTVTKTYVTETISQSLTVTIDGTPRRAGMELPPEVVEILGEDFEPLLEDYEMAKAAGRDGCDMAIQIRERCDLLGFSLEWDRLESHQ